MGTRKGRRKMSAIFEKNHKRFSSFFPLYFVYSPLQNQNERLQMAVIKCTTECIRARFGG